MSVGQKLIKMKKIIVVRRPDGTAYNVCLDPKDQGIECLNQVLKDYLKMSCETEFFGLQYSKSKESRTKCWLNLRNDIKDVLPNDPYNIINLDLRVKYWVPVHYLNLPMTKELFFMNARLDMLEGRLKPKDWDQSAEFGGLLAHIDENFFFSMERLNQTPASSPVVYNVDRSVNAETTVCSKKRRLSTRHKSNAVELSQSNKVVGGSQESSSPLSIYMQYVIKPEGVSSSVNTMPKDFLRQIAIKHMNLVQDNVAIDSAKFRFLQQISDLDSFGEEIFSGFLTSSSTNCDIGVRPDGLFIYEEGKPKESIPFSAISKADASGKRFCLTYLNEDNNETIFSVKMPNTSDASSIYRSIIEYHEFYSCDSVGQKVQAQFIRDIFGTIMSLFKEDTPVGKRFVFDCLKTQQEVMDDARRICHTKKTRAEAQFIGIPPSSDGKGEEKTPKESTSCCVVCLDAEINAVFLPCKHLHCCSDCAEKCDQCPACRTKIEDRLRIYPR